MRTRHLAALAGLALFSFGLRAQSVSPSVFVLPSGNSSTATAFTFPGLTPIGPNNGTFTATASTTQVIASADGTKYYVVSNSTSNTIVVESPQLSNPLPVAGFPGGAAAAVLRKDGRQLLVATGNALQVLNTQNDTLAVPGGIPLGNVAASAVDLDVSIDSIHAFVLLNTSGSYSLATVDLRSLSLVNTVAISGAATGVSVGPNGLVYVSSTGQVLELDPNSQAVRSTIAVVGATPGKLYFTPRGAGLAINQQAAAQAPAILIFDLTAKTLSSTIPLSSFVPPPNAISAVVPSQLFPLSNNRVLVYAASVQTLYDVTLNVSSVVAFGFASPGSVAAVATSKDFPPAANSSTHYLFFVGGNTLFQFDLRGNSNAGQVTFTGTAGALSVATPVLTAGTLGAPLTYGDQQVVQPASTTAPLVVRVVDSNGNPLAGVAVTFSPQAGVTLQTSSTVLTNNDGLASTTATVPSTTGAVTIGFTVTGGQGGSFTVNVGQGGGVAANGGLSAVAGQGSLIREQTSTAAANATMTVKLVDANGNAVSNATIAFNVTSGNGSIQCAAAAILCNATSTSLTVQTDSNGMAQADYFAPPVNPTPPGLDPATITASTTAGASVTFFVTAFSFIRIPIVTLLAQSPLQVGSSISGSAGQTLTGAILVQISSGTGQLIPNVSLFIANPPNPTVSPSATCANVFALSDVNGNASCDLVLGGKTGTVQISAEAGYFASSIGPFNVTVTPGAPAKANIIQGNNQSGKPGDTLPLALKVQITDAFGNPSPNMPVTWTVLSGSVTLSNKSAGTDFNGFASTLATLGNFVGNAQVQITSGSASATFTLTVSVAISGVQIVSGNNQTATVNSQFANALVVKVATAQGPVPNFPVTFAITSGSGTLSNPNATTDANGNASTNVNAGGTAGGLVITATSAGFQATFNLTVIPPGPTNVIFLNAASLQLVKPPATNVVSPGEIVVMQGNNLTPGVVGLVVANNLVGAAPFTLAGITVTFNNTFAPIFSVSNLNGVQQITVQVPFELVGTTSATVNITTPGNGSGSFNVTVQAYAPGVIETSAFGLAHQTLALHSDGSYVSPANPAHLGEIIIVFVIGVGQTNPATGTNQAGVPGQSVAATVIVGLGGGGVPLVSAQTVVGQVGVYAIAVQVPADLAPGAQVGFGFVVYDAANNAYYAQDTVVPISQ